MHPNGSTFVSALTKRTSVGVGFVVLLGLMFAAAVPEPAASGGMILEALDRCPVSEPTCVVMEANLRWPGDIADHPAVRIIDIGQDKDGSLDRRTAIVSVEGRLNGGPRQPYRVRFDYPEEGMYCEDFVVAALGASRDGGALLTRQGVLEIESAEIEIGSRSNLALIDLDGGSMSIRLAPRWQFGLWDGQAFVSPDRKVFWRSGEACLDLETHARFQRVDDGHCGAGQLSRFSSEMTQASKQDVKRVTELRVFSDTETIERLEFDLWRIEGVPFLIYVYGVACT